MKVIEKRPIIHFVCFTKFLLSSGMASGDVTKKPPREESQLTFGRVKKKKNAIKL